MFTSIAKNTIIQMAGKVISLFLSLIAIGMMTRYLGQEGFGFYITATSFLQIFATLVDFGISLTIVRMIASVNVDESKTMSAIMTLRVISTAVFLALAVAMIWFFPYNIYIKLGALITVFAFFATNIIQALAGVFQKQLKMIEVTIAELVGRIVWIGSVAVVIWLDKGIYWMFGTLSVCLLVNLLIQFLFSRKYIVWRWSVDIAIWKEVLKKTWPIALSISFNLIYLRMDTIILSLTRTQAEVGLYGATYRVIDILTLLPAIFMGIVLPVAVRYFSENNKVELRSLLQKSFDALMIFAVPITVGTLLVSQKLMVLVAGQEFAAAGGILNLLIAAVIPIFCMTLFGYAVVAIDRQRSIMWGFLIDAVLTMVGYLIFIPMYGYWGAAAMTVFSELFIMVWGAAVVYKHIHFFPSFKVFIRVLPATFLMAIALWLAAGWHVLALLVLAGAVYLALVYLMGGVKKETVKELIGLK